MQREKPTAYERAIVCEKPIAPERAKKTEKTPDHLSVPPAHIHARAKRRAVKLFLSHYFDKAYRLHFGSEPPRPYVFAHMEHTDFIPAPEP